MNIAEKRNIEVPFLNIESFGTYIKDSGWNQLGNYFKYYVASLDFNVKKIFSSYNKIVYIPILFYNDVEIKKIMEYYSNLYFCIRFKYGYSGVHYSDTYHISNFVDFDKIYKKEIDKMETKPNAHGIDFVIKDYKGYDIGINTQYMSYDAIYDGYYNQKYVDNICSPNDIMILVSTKHGDKTSLNYIKDNYLKYPSIISYYIKQKDDNTYGSLFNSKKLENVILHIDNLDKENKIRDTELENMYSKKTFKLVEN